jgi:soluble lytic murein transglycosylase
MIRRLSLTILSVTVLALASTAGYAADSVQAIKDASRGKWSAAKSAAGTGTARDLVTWMYLTSGDTSVSFSEIAAFVTKHPEWPAADRLYKVAEGRLPSNLSDAQILNWFSRNAPVTGAGMKRYMGAMERQGREQEAVRTLKEWWVTANLGAEEQKNILSTYSRYLTQADHVRRLERILGDHQYTPARALASEIGRGYQQVVEARVALQEGGNGISKRMSEVPSGLMNDTGLLLSRVQFRRANGETDGAIALLNQAPPAGTTTDPSAWWKERNILARRKFEQGDYRTAYKLASQHGLPMEGQDFAAAEFFSGWVALRFLRQPGQAFDHFERLYNNAATPITRARAAYWAGRASEALNGREIATQWYQAAAQYQTTFYGQQAAERIGMRLDLANGDRPQITAAQKAAFNGSSLTQATKLLDRAGLKEQRAQFLRAMMKASQTPQDYSQLADMVMSMNLLDTALKVAKEAEKSGITLVDYQFPTIMRTLSSSGNADKALVHALIRQESQFDPNAVSVSGALGLMQIMPATGKYTAKKNGLSHNTAWLTSKPEHNVEVGSMYIEELLKKYKGSVPMAVAAYNAGPGRVNQWVKEFGDPRADNVDLIDWVESIPIYETRNYVHRVMEGYAVYQAKLDRGHTPALRVERISYNP